MILNVCSTKLLKVGLSPSEYFILFLLHSNEIKLLEEFMKNTDMFSYTHDDSFLGIIQHLQLKGWLKITTYGDFKFEDIILRKKAEDLFEVNNKSKFDELWLNYPFKVPNGCGGYRKLRAQGIDGTEYNQLKEKWQKIVKSKPDLPDIMIKALNKQLKDTRTSLQYMQMFSVWLNKATWEKYTDFDEDVEKEIGIKDI